MRYLTLFIALTCLSCAEQPEKQAAAEDQCESHSQANGTVPCSQEVQPSEGWSDCRITLTEAAAKQVKTILVDFTPLHRLRASVRGTGCDGFTQHLDIDDKVDPDKDIAFASRGVKLVIDKRSSLYMGEAVIDWDDDKKGFAIENSVTKSQK